MEDEKDIPLEDEAEALMLEANKIISEKDKEIKELKVKLAKSALYRTTDEEPEEYFDINEKFDPSNKTNLEIAEYATKVHDYYASIDREEDSPLEVDGAGSGNAISNFYKECISEAREYSNADEKFLSIYQTKLPDSKSKFGKKK